MAKHKRQKLRLGSSPIKGTWQCEEGVVYQGDCLEIMKTLPEQSVDLIISSPPYEDSRLYLEDGKDLGIARDTEKWTEWMIEVIKASLHICKGLVAYVVGHGKRGCSRWTGAPALLCADLIRQGIILRNPCIYSRIGIMGSGGSDWLKANYEWIVCCANQERLPWSDNTACGHPPKFGPGGEISHRTKSGKRANHKGDGYRYSSEQHEALNALMESEGLNQREAVRRLKMPTRKGHSGYTEGKPKLANHYIPPELANPGNVIELGAVGGGHLGSNIAHENEAPYPAKLPNFFIRSFCPPGGTVLDPFSGSATTLAEALKLGRKFIGIDLRKSQIKLAKRRLGQARLDKGFGL